MRTPILLLFAHAYYAFYLQIAISTECGHQGVRIHVHLNRNAYCIMHEQTTKELVYALGTGNT